MIRLLNCIIDTRSARMHLLLDAIKLTLRTSSLDSCKVSTGLLYSYFISLFMFINKSHLIDLIINFFNPHLFFMLVNKGNTVNFHYE